MKKIGFFLLCIFTLSAFNIAVDRVVTGRVTSAEDGSPLPGVLVTLKGTKTSTYSDADGKYSITVPEKGGKLVFEFIGLKREEIVIGSRKVIDVAMSQETRQLSEMIMSGEEREKNKAPGKRSKMEVKDAAGVMGYSVQPMPVEENTEEYAGIVENVFHDVVKDPLSTFSIDVDRASYSNVRRFINLGQKPPVDAVRIEEMINYFSYDYPQPTGEHPFTVTTEISEAPWNAKHKLVHVGLKGKDVPVDNLPASNLVFLIDVSGSMGQPNKLPLVKQSFTMLVDQLREKDMVSIVVYAGAAGAVLEPTSGKEKKKILAALDRLQAGGSTAGGAGLKLAYSLAQDNFKQNGNNRVIIATDGDFNVGESSNDAMEDLIVEKRKEGVFLTVLGFGMGNYKDSKMEILADKGNGNYGYIDNISEARKMLVSEFGGTLFTLAKDVKLQLEFNPSKVYAYRLIGYENRMLKSEDFNNDKKDAGEMGSGHTVTALYEIIPVGVKSEFFNIDELKYQRQEPTPVGKYNDEMLTVKIRYKKPDEDTSKLLTHTLKDSQKDLSAASDNLRWSASVAAFGMLLRGSEYVGEFSYDQVAELAQGARGKDAEGYRAEFVNMVKSFSLVAKK